MDVDVTEPRTVARVRFLSSDRTAVHFELRDGRFASSNSDMPLALNPGDVVLINPDYDGFVSAPQELWVEESWIGVVKLVLDGEIVVQNGLAPEGLSAARAPSVAPRQHR